MEMAAYQILKLELDVNIEVDMKMDIGSDLRYWKISLDCTSRPVVEISYYPLKHGK